MYMVSKPLPTLLIGHSVKTQFNHFNAVVRGKTDDTSRWTTKMIDINTYESSKTRRYDTNEVKDSFTDCFTCLSLIDASSHKPSQIFQLSKTVFGPPCTIIFFHFSIEFSLWSNTLMTFESPLKLCQVQPQEHSVSSNQLFDAYVHDIFLHYCWCCGEQFWIICSLHYTSSLIWFKVSTVYEAYSIFHKHLFDTYSVSSS